MSSDLEEKNKVFEVADSLLPAAKAFARRVRLDPDTAQEAMAEAAKRVLEFQRSESGETSLPKIQNLTAYLFTVFKNVLLAELRRHERELALGDDNLITRGRGTCADEIRSVENEILVSEIVNRMNPKSRIIFNDRVLGYSYEEIAERFRTKMGIRITAATLRSDYSKDISRITKEINP